MFKAEAIDAGEFTPLLTEVTTQMVELFSILATAVDEDRYPQDVGPLRVQAAMMGDLIDVRERRGVDAERLRQVRTLMRRRLDAGGGEQGFSSLIKELVPAPSAT